jgi:cytochrome c oxidase subunit IV
MSQYKAQTHKIGVYLWIWALLFVFSFFSYMVDYLNFEGLLRWTLILVFMVSKAALIVAVFMHLFWERYAIVNVLLWPMTLMLLFVGIMAAESEYTLFTRLLYFVAGS